MKKINGKRLQRRANGYSALRVYHRKQRGKKSPRLLIKCGDCDEKLEIYYDPKRRDIEIAGVFGSVENWREILLPLLSPPRRRHRRQFSGAITERADRTTRGPFPPMCGGDAASFTSSSDKPIHL